MSCCNNRPQKIIIDCGGGTSETVEFVVSNANLTGTGVFLAQGDTTLTFRGIASSGGTITVSADNVNQTVNVEANTSAIVAAFPDATTAVKGKVELATDAETIAKTDTARAITPSNLAALPSTTTFVGLTRFATNAETIAGVLATVAVTPAGLDATLDQFPTMQVFANAAARATATPTFIGQVGVQQDTLVPYLGSNTLAGYFDAPLLAVGIPNQIESDTELAVGAELVVTSVTDDGILFANGGVLGMASTGRIWINNSVVPGNAVLVTSSTDGQMAYKTIAEFLSSDNNSDTYTLGAFTERRTVPNAATATTEETMDVLCTLLTDLFALLRPTNVV